MHHNKHHMLSFTANACAHTHISRERFFLWFILLCVSNKKKCNNEDMIFWEGLTYTHTYMAQLCGCLRQLLVFVWLFCYSPFCCPRPFLRIWAFPAHAHTHESYMVETRPRCSCDLWMRLTMFSRVVADNSPWKHDVSSLQGEKQRHYAQKKIMCRTAPRNVKLGCGWIKGEICRVFSFLAFELGNLVWYQPCLNEAFWICCVDVGMKTQKIGYWEGMGMRNVKRCERHEVRSFQVSFCVLVVCFGRVLRFAAIGLGVVHTTQKLTPWLCPPPMSSWLA